MSRLIDADKLLDEFISITPYGMGEVGIKAVDDLIKSQPTAYDVEKVWDGVSEALDRLFNFCEEIDLNLPEDERTGYKMLNDIWAIRDIVGRGGKK